jgi:hypothetical protein
VKDALIVDATCRLFRYTSMVFLLNDRGEPCQQNKR